MYIALLINFKLLRRKREERRGDDGEWFFVTRNIEVKEKINPSTRMIITMMTIIWWWWWSAFPDGELFARAFTLRTPYWNLYDSQFHRCLQIFPRIFVYIPRSIRFSPSCISNYEFVAANCKLASISNGKRKKKSINGELFFNCIPRMFAERRRVLLFCFFFSDRTSEAKFVAAGTERSNQSWLPSSMMMNGRR